MLESSFARSSADWDAKTSFVLSADELKVTLMQLICAANRGAVDQVTRDIFTEDSFGSTRRNKTECPRLFTNE